MKKRFVPLFEILTGKKHELTERLIHKEKEETEVEKIYEVEEKSEEELPKISLEPEILAEVEITPPETFEIEEKIEIPEEEIIQEESAEKFAETIASPPIQKDIREFQEIEQQNFIAEPELPKTFSEFEKEKYERSEEITSEEKEYSYVKERIEGRKKIVEGGEDIKRKIIISIEVEGEEKNHRNGKSDKVDFTVYKPSEAEPEVKEDKTEKTKEEDIKQTLQEKFKIISMEEEKPKEDKKTPSEEVRKFYETKGSRLFLQEIIDRIRSDIIAKAEVEAKKIVAEAEKRAKEIIDNAYRESERLLNESLSRSLDISREIEKEAEEKGFKAGFEKGVEEGKVKGYEDAYKKTLSEGRYALEMFRKISDEIAYAKERFSDDFPKIVLHLTLVALKSILMTNSLKDEELIVRVMKDAFEKVREFKIVKIRVNNLDLETVKKFFQIPPEIDVIPDPSVERGDVKIEMREGYFESSIKWREKIIEETLRNELETLIHKEEERRKEEEEKKKSVKAEQEMKEELKEKFKEEVEKALEKEQEKS
ncbi:MAG: FliH/SctL family protein [Candidatus Calescibacterium sp.]|nr:FliH/SctL family protein [Candidatus Calescibacterium sp.]MDW8087673.1 FliH/SctL family protein [Candidatus Calescibacterium sp.]